MMLMFRRPIPLLFVLPFVHLLLYFAVEFAISDSEGGWKWIPLIIIDLPYCALILLPLEYLLTQDVVLSNGHLLVRYK